MQADNEQILYKMLLARRLDEEIIARHPKQLMRCPLHLSLGQEAIGIGATHHLRKDDSVFSTHRNHAHYVGKNGDINKFVLEIHGKIGGCMDGRGGSMHSMDKDVNFMSIPIVGSAIALAAGVALRNKIDGNGNIVMVFFGDASVEEGIFAETMNFASLMQLPIIFVCEDNSYSVDTHINKRQPDCRPLSAVGLSHGFYPCHIDMTYNVFDIADIFKGLIENTRYNNPVFVVCDTQRSCVHCGIDEEFKLKNDPMTALEEKFTFAQINRQSADIKFAIKNAFNAAEAAPLPTPEMASKYVYA